MRIGLTPSISCKPAFGNVSGLDIETGEQVRLKMGEYLQPGNNSARTRKYKRLFLEEITVQNAAIVENFLQRQASIRELRILQMKYNFQTTAQKVQEKQLELLKGLIQTVRNKHNALKVLEQQVKFLKKMMHPSGKKKSPKQSRLKTIIPTHP